MAKIVIEVPDDCRKCSCFIKAEANVGPDEKTFYLCREFSRILEIGVNGYGNVKEVHRCAECEAAEVFDKKVKEENS